MKILKKIGPWIISAALCVLAVELLGAGMFYADKKSLVYFNEPIVTTKATVTEPTAEPVYRQRLHPYFGYTGTYSIHGDMFTNNLGFPQKQERVVPFEPKSNEYIVFVFGSSIAGNLVGTLQQALQKLPALKNKTVVVYCMAQGPGKQPQHLMELAFLIALGQHIDLVLNIDGTIEFVSAVANFENGVDPIFPPVEVFGALGRELKPIDASASDYYEATYGVIHTRAEIKRYSSLLDRSLSGIEYIKNRIFVAMRTKELEGKTEAYDKAVTKTVGWEGVRSLLSLDMSIQTSKEKVIEYAFDIWIRCSELMKIMANAKGARFLNIVHPNPYHSRKAFTSAEKTVLNIPESNNLRHGASAGHALIESRSEMLKSRGIVSGITIFDDVPDTVYIDSTGHLSKLGETILVDFVANQVGAQIGSSQDR